MVLFIKFTFGIINVGHINKILIKNNQYYIHVIDNHFFSQKIFKICEIKNKTDYTIIKHWINSM
jgi:hypothetical protein